MSKARIESFIPKAVELLSKEFTDGTIASAYNGYISSFGASIIQSGLKPTLAVFENTNSNSKEDKSFLAKLILKLLDPNTQESSLLKYVLANKDKEALLKEQILDIAVAIKLSIRTFKLV
jgi:CRISPR-associated protein Cmr5